MMHPSASVPTFSMNDTSITATTNRSLEVIIAEAADIGRHFRVVGHHTPKNPNLIARLVSLLEESGLPLSTFAAKARVGESSLCFWRRGYNSSGKEWPNLQAALAARKGAALASLINSEVEAHKPTAPAKVAPELIGVAGTSMLAEFGVTLSSDQARAVDVVSGSKESVVRTGKDAGCVKSNGAAGAAFTATVEHKGDCMVAESAVPAKRGPGRPKKTAATSAAPGNVGDSRIVSIEADTGVIIVERVVVAREELKPGTPEHTAIVLDLYRRTKH